MEDKNTPLEVVSTSALEQMERAQIDVQISTAKAYPRNYSVVKRDMLSLATLDAETAATCFYTLKRRSGDGSEKKIQGPSARLAEIAANSFGNMYAVSRIIGNDGKMITAQAVCHDLEKNVRIGVEVKRRITDKNGRTFSDDMQVVTGNAACSIALRNAIFKVIPMALIKPIYEKAKATAVGDSKTLAERRKAALVAFEQMGIKKERVFAAIGKKGEEDIGLAELEELIGMHTAIKDGDTTIDEAFPLVAKNPDMSAPAAPSLFTTGKGKDTPKSKQASAVPEDNIVILRDLMKQAKVEEPALIEYLVSVKAIDDSLASLEDVMKVTPSAIEGAVNSWEFIAKKLHSAAK